LVTAHIGGPNELTEFVIDERALIERMARCVTTTTAAPAEGAAIAVLANGLELTIPLAGVVDLAKECAKLRNELAGLEKQLNALRGRLANEKFTGKAPIEVVDAERAKEREWSARAEQLHTKVRDLCG
jgi:valyl-tRNA synthetase